MDQFGLLNTEMKGVAVLGLLVAVDAFHARPARGLARIAPRVVGRPRGAARRLGGGRPPRAAAAGGPPPRLAAPLSAAAPPRPPPARLALLDATLGEPRLQAAAIWAAFALVLASFRRRCTVALLT